jgi:hypothetical protein
MVTSVFTPTFDGERFSFGDDVGLARLPVVFLLSDLTFTSAFRKVDSAGLRHDAS